MSKDATLTYLKFHTATPKNSLLDNSFGERTSEVDSHRGEFEDITIASKQFQKKLVEADENNILKQNVYKNKTACYLICEQNSNLLKLIEKVIKQVVDDNDNLDGTEPGLLDYLINTFFKSKDTWEQGFFMLTIDL